MNIQERAGQVARWGKSWFSAPHLPMRLVAIIIVFLITQAVLILITQPAAYWLDPRYTSPNVFGSDLAAQGPWIFLGVVFIFLLICSLLLARLNRNLALVLAGYLIFFHLVISGDVSYCQLTPNLWFSKRITCDVFLTAHLIIWAIILTTAVTGISPNVLQPHFFRAKIFENSRVQRAIHVLPIVLITAWVGLLAYAVVRSATIPKSGWQPLAPQHSPSAREGMGIAYDTTRNRAVLFGGRSKNARNEYFTAGDTWEWDGNDWIEVHTEDSPPARFYPSMAYDEARRVVVLYGGSNQNGILRDVWEYDGKQWTMRCPSCTPSARWGAKMIYDPQRKMVVLYGGTGIGESEEETIWYTEAWAWDGVQWSYDAIDSAAPAIFNPTIVYERSQNRAVAFLPYRGTWLWKDRIWTRPEISNQPPYIAETSMVYDPVFMRTIFHGGYNHDSRRYYSETWEYFEDSWTRRKTPLNPPPRRGQIAFYDASRGSMILFGGTGPHNKYMNDTWELPLSNPTLGDR